MTVSQDFLFESPKYIEFRADGFSLPSPEMRDAKARIKELEAINESHQELNGNLRREITALEQEKLELHIDNKKLADQIQDQVERARKAGM